MCCTTLFSAGTAAATADTDGTYQEQVQMEDGREFDPGVPGVYKCVYQITPKDGEEYLIARNITVSPREAETPENREGSAEDSGGEDDGEVDAGIPLEAETSATEFLTAESADGVMPQGMVADELTAEPVTETGSEFQTETSTELTTESESESESETESESESEKEGEHEVNITKGEEFGITLDHKDGSYDAGETVVFSTNLPEGSLTAVGALKEESNAQGGTADLLYSEVTYHADSDGAGSRHGEVWKNEFAEKISSVICIEHQSEGNSMVSLIHEKCILAPEGEAQVIRVKSD